MQKLTSLFLSLVFAAALHAGAGDKALELPAEKFRISRIGKINADETKDRFSDLWFLFEQQYNFADGKFVRKDPKASDKNATRFPLRAEVAAVISDKMVFCRLPGTGKTTIVALETNSKPELSKPVAVWVEPAGTEEYKGASYPKFREVTATASEKLAPIPPEADVQKAFLAAIKAGTTFPVTVTETRKCPPCFGVGKVNAKGDSFKLIPEKVSCDACAGTGKRTAKVDVVLQN